MNRYADGKTIATILLIVITLTAYWNIRYHEFIFFDDQIYITNNRHVHEGFSKESLVWAFTNTDTGHWHPITWISHIMDYELFRLNPAWHYGTNILLHLINVLLLLICLQKLTGRFWHSLMVSALFAVHPLNVESVAWVAERKNLLSTTFWLLTMLCYARYVKKPSPVRYLLLTIVFIGGLLTKPMLVTLPFVLLLLDVWPLRRTDFKRIPWGLLTEKSPLIVLSIISVIITIAAAHSVGTIAEMNAITLTDRIQNAFLSYAIYIYKMFWPFDLAVFYPYPKVFNPLIVALAAFFLLMISAMAWRLRRAQPYLLLGWLWFLGTLLPVI